MSSGKIPAKGKDLQKILALSKRLLEEAEKKGIPLSKRRANRLAGEHYGYPKKESDVEKSWREAQKMSNPKYNFR